MSSRCGKCARLCLSAPWRSIGLDVSNDQRQIHQVALRAAAANAHSLRQRTLEALDRSV